MAEFKKEWPTKLEQLERKLQDWNRDYEREFERVRKENGYGRLFKRMTDAQRQSVAEEARRRAGGEPLTELSSFLDELCALFLESLPGVRAQIRAHVGFHVTVFSLLWSYVTGTPERVQGERAEEELRLGLAAVAIDDMRSDYGGVLGVLAQHWLQAVRAGVDPAPVFREVAALANPGTSGGGAHMGEVMGEFATSDYFRKEVAPLARGRGEAYRPAS